MSASEVTARSVEWSINGDVYRLTPITLKDLGDIESRLRTTKLAVFMQACESVELPKEEKARRINHLAGVPISRSEVIEGMQQPSMTPFVLLKHLKREHPKMTEEQVQSLLDGLDGSGADELVACLKGLSTGGKDDGADPTKASTRTGAESSDTS